MKPSNHIAVSLGLPPEDRILKVLYVKPKPKEIPALDYLRSVRGALPKRPKRWVFSAAILFYLFSFLVLMTVTLLLHKVFT